MYLAGKRDDLNREGIFPTAARFAVTRAVDDVIENSRRAQTQRTRDASAGRAVRTIKARESTRTLRETARRSAGPSKLEQRRAQAKQERALAAKFFDTQEAAAAAAAPPPPSGRRAASPPRMSGFEMKQQEYAATDFQGMDEVPQATFIRSSRVVRDHASTRPEGEPAHMAWYTNSSQRAEMGKHTRPGAFLAVSPRTQCIQAQQVVKGMKARFTTDHLWGKLGGLPPPKHVEVLVPAHVRDGETMRVAVPEGFEINMVVPRMHGGNGIIPGKTVRLEYDLGACAPVC